ncbi:MAG: NADH-quinone oxidoreductase subunit M, partial [Actinomycetota bacterium]|nr:NADH-quinone oxidoreductase subunit M [Actinomycetota bacterium]
MHSFQQQAGFPILTVMTFLPTLGALVMLALMRGRPQLYKSTALVTAGATFFLSLAMVLKFDQSSADFQFIEKVSWIERLGASYHMGVDGISVLLILLTTLLSLVIVPASWNYIKDR